MAIDATAQWQADLSQVLALVKRQLAPRDRAKLDTLRALAGDARGSLSLNGTFEQLHILAEADSLRAQASLEQLPWPIQVTGARVRFDGGELVVQGLAGTVGEQQLRPVRGAAHARCRVQAPGEQLQRRSCARRAVRLGVEAVRAARCCEGAARARRARAGPGTHDRREPGAAGQVVGRHQRDAQGAAPGSSAGAGRAGTGRGSIRGDPGALTIQRVKAEVLDTTLQVSGSVSGLRDGKPSLDVQAAGPVGEKILAWAWHRAGVEHSAARIAPFEARPVALRWPVTDGGFETRGDLMFAGKTTVGFDALIQPAKLDLRKLDRSGRILERADVRPVAAGRAGRQLLRQPDRSLADQDPAEQRKSRRSHVGQLDLPSADQAAPRFPRERTASGPSGNVARRARRARRHAAQRRAHGGGALRASGHIVLAAGHELRCQRHDPRDRPALCARPRRQVGQRRRESAPR